MFNKLILDVFDKAKQETHTDVLRHLAIHIADNLWANNGFQINERTLRNYYKKATSNEEIDFKLSPKVASLFSQYLGHSNYQSYIVYHNKVQTPQRIKIQKKTSETIQLLSILCLFLFLVAVRSILINSINIYHTPSLMSIELMKSQKGTLINEVPFNYYYSIISLDSTRHLIYSISKSNEIRFHSIIELVPLDDDESKTSPPKTNYAK